MPASRSQKIAGGAVALSIATTVGIRNIRQRRQIPEHTETHLSVSCADGRYAQARASEAMRLRPHWWGPEPRTVFPQTPPGGGAAVLHPTFGPAVIDAIGLLRGVHRFDLVELRLHVGGPGGCGFLNTMAATDEAVWAGPVAGSRPVLWSELDVASPVGVLRVGELAREIVGSVFADDPIDVRIRIDQFGHNLAGLPTVRTLTVE
jgi:hypothetical protein